MPTYLSISFEYSKQRLSATTVQDFCDTLQSCGLSFAGGYWEAERESYEEILHWNQAKLTEDFQLGDEEHYSHDYRQMLFHFGGFSEVRLFIDNIRDRPFFTFELIIPEKDFFGGEDAVSGRLWPERLALVKELAVCMWETGMMDCIQAYWESWDESKPFANIETGEKPCCTPFCILPRRVMRDEWQLTCRMVDRDGLLCWQEK